METPRRLRIGTSGWHYKDWIGRFYPKNLRAADFLSYYARIFNTVELNNVFYSLPTAKTVLNWYSQTPKGFSFAYRASRFITHLKKLRDSQEALKAMFSRADLLKEKLGPVLFQLPYLFEKNIERLAGFLKILPHGYTQVFEFRHLSWFSEDVYELLEHFNVGLCLYEIKGSPSPVAFPSRTAYVRLHGAQEKYRGHYTDHVLAQWAGLIRKWGAAKKNVNVYFNNERGAQAAKNAQSLKKMLK